MKTKLRKRAGSLLLVLLMALSNFTPYTAYGGVQAGSNDNDAGGQRIPATYNMHGWGAMVTLVTLDNPYTESELTKLAEDYEKKKDKTSVAITRATETKYLKTFPDFWLKSDVAGKSALIFIGSHDKYNEWNSGKMPTNKFVAKDGVSVKISKSYAVDRTAASPGSITINVIADVIRADEALKEKFFNGELTWTKVKSLANDNNNKLEAGRIA